MAHTMKTTTTILLAIVVAALTGCTSFKVKNTEGLRLAYEDIEQASSKGVELKSMKYINDRQRQEAADLYRDAKAALNSYLQQAITDASSYTVDKPAETYAACGADKKVALFRAKVNDLRGRTPAAAAVWIPIAVEVITEIKKLHDQEQKAAYERFEQTVKKYMMKDFDELPAGSPEK